MSRQIIVKTLSGFHLGKRITITTANTTATGVLQGFMHDADHITTQELGGHLQYALGQPESSVRLLPGQTILCELTDKVTVHSGDDLPQGPRTVEVLHQLPDIEIISRDYIIYGQAITGWPIIKAIIAEAPRNDYDHEWLDTYLPAHVTPYGEIIHAYKGGEDGQGD